MKSILAYFILVTIICCSCVYNNEEDLYPVSECNNIYFGYKSAVMPILEGHCYVCHSEAANVAGINFESYDKIKFYVNNGSLIGAITHSPNYTAMPLSDAQLDKCLIEIIERWIQEGALNN